MEKVIKWIDDTNQQFSYINYKIKNNQECTFEYRSWNNDIECYTNESEKHIYNLLSIILQASNENKVFIFKRIFRHSRDFFYYCNELRENDPYSWIIRVWLNSSMSGERNAEKLKSTLLYDLLMFYSEALQLCYECNLPSTALPQYDFATGVIEDILADMKLPHKRIQPNIEWQDYIIGENKQAWIKLIKKELKSAGNKNGRLVATIILALQQTSSILAIQSKKQFYDALRADFPNLNSDTAINKYLNAESPNSYTTPIPEDEIIAIINKIGCH